MPDEPTEPENEPTDEPKPEPEPKADDRTARSDDDPVDWVAEARKWEKQAKANSDAASKLKELEDAQKTEQERLTEKLNATETRAKEAELKAARLEVATEKGLPKTSVKFLTGTTPEELEASADELLELIKPKQDEPSDGKPKPRLEDDTPSDDNDKLPKELADSIWSEDRL